MGAKKEVEEGQIRKTVVMPKGLANIVEKRKGSPGNPVNWAAYLLYLVVSDMSKGGGK